MITKTITAANQYSDPIRIAGNMRPVITVRQTTAPFSATVQVERHEDIFAATPPASSDTGWLAVQSASVSSDGKMFSGLPGNAWYRAGVPTGGYTSGQASITLSSEKATN